MEVKYVPKTKVEEKTPFVVGGVYTHKVVGTCIVLVRMCDGMGSDRYAFLNPSDGFVGPASSRGAAEFQLCAYNYLPGAYIAIPKEA